MKTRNGISGTAFAVPPFQVDLQDWCDWHQANWNKISHAIGASYRIPGPDQNVYTLAATAAMRLIQNYGTDPSRIGYLALGTESSTDNSAGAIIIKGMLDDALLQTGLPPISRHCEVPEFKHACLGGMYALKGALRYLSMDGHDRAAIVICSDIAEYEPGSSGEPTQGAGAVAMLIDREAKLATVDLDFCGSAACYRGPDFRKPFSRFLRQLPDGSPRQSVKDFPLLNGQYSTHCYIDEILAALDDMFSKRTDIDRRDVYFRNLPAVFLHRPYHRLPRNAWGIAYLAALSKGQADEHKELDSYCRQTGIDLEKMCAEINSRPDMFSRLQQGNTSTPYPLTNEVLQNFRISSMFKSVVTERMHLGSAQMMKLGNLYTASLPAWIAAGFEDALAANLDCAGDEWLTLGYGSGDAAEIMPMWISPDWWDSAVRINISAALADPVNVTRQQYTRLHEHGYCEGLEKGRPGEFVIAGRGVSESGPIRDMGLEYYEYLR